jgi:hypothetical protein
MKTHYTFRKLILLLALLSTFVSQADKMTLSLHRFIDRCNSESKYVNQKNEDLVTVMVRVNPDDLSEICDNDGDMKLVYNVGTTACMTLPISKIDRLAEYDAVKLISLPAKSYLNMDLSRAFIKVNDVQDSQSLPPDMIPYTGKGVVIGMIDGGIDPHHVTFLNSDRTESHVPGMALTLHL